MESKQQLNLVTSWEPNKSAFLKTWPGGYDENFEVYTKECGLTEEQIVNTCLKPYYDPDGVVLEVGCGKGFWVRKYLVPNFGNVFGVDVIPREWVQPGDCDNFCYIEVDNYTLDKIADDSVDFVWSFGLFCHLPLSAIQTYLNAIHRVLMEGGHASLYFSNKDKRPMRPTTFEPDPDKDVGWTENDWVTTSKMLYMAGFNEIREVLKHGKDTLAIVRK